MNGSKIIMISKEEAKRIIDESPADKVCVTIIDTDKKCSGDTESMLKSEGYLLIEQAKKIGYENHDIFGRLRLRGIKRGKDGFMHCLVFVQGNPPIDLTTL